MDDLEKIIKVYNHVFIKQINKIQKTLETQNMDDSAKNNLNASGDLLIKIVKLMQKGEIIVALPCLRNVYEMTLIAIVLEDNKEIFDLYNKMLDEEKRSMMSKVRFFIGKNLNKYFCVFNDNGELKKYLGDGILTYLYHCLCRLAHATKVNEVVYLAQKDTELWKSICNFFTIFLIYPMIMVYIDAVYTKIGRGYVSQEISGVFTVGIILVLLVIKNDNKLMDSLKNINKHMCNIVDESCFKDMDSQKELAQKYINDMQNLMSNNGIDEGKLNLQINKLGKFFSEQQKEELIEIFLL